jgi:hypothetical protein
MRADPDELTRTVERIAVTAVPGRYARQDDLIGYRAISDANLCAACKKLRVS